MIRRLPIFIASLLSLPGAAREPTDLEQFYLEIVNRARADPDAEVARLSDQPDPPHNEVWGDEGAPVTADLNEGLPPGTISNAPKPPLAFDPRLIDAASDYSDFLLATEQFGHTANGTPPSRMEAAGYPFASPSLAAENLATTASTGPFPVNADRVEGHHKGLFIDNDVANRGHRVNLLRADFREVGIAIRADSNGLSIFGPGFNEVLSTQNFASSAGRVFLTGVIYRDRNFDGFYTPGESSGILDLQVRTTSGSIVASGRSFGSGGYSLNLADLGPGDYELVAFDAFGFDDRATFTWAGTENVKLDLVNPDLVAPPVRADPYRPDGHIGASPQSLSGNDVISDSGGAQVVRMTARNRRPLVWHAAIENDGALDDTLFTTASAGNRLFTAKYLKRQGQAFVNVTASLRTGLTDALQTGQTVVYQIGVTPSRSALGRRTGFQFHLRSRSDNDDARVDRVNGALINRTKAPKPRRRR